jgi:hypothetical protein
MQKRNYGQVKRQKEATRKARQAEKQDRRRRETPADKSPDGAVPDAPSSGTP